MDPITGAALLTGAGSIATSVIGNIGSGRRQRKADAVNLANWHRQNEYNHPQQQMERLIKAGLNPNLIYGQGGGSQQVGDVAPSKAADYKMDLGDPIGKYYQGKSTEAITDRTEIVIQQMEAQMDLIAAQKIETEARTLGLLIDNRSKISIEESLATAAKYATPLAQHNVEFNSKNLEVLNQIQIGKEQDIRIGKQTLATGKQTLATAKLQHQTLTQTQAAAIQKATIEKKQADQTLKGLQYKNKIDSIKVELAKKGVFDNTPYWLKLFAPHTEKLKMTPYKSKKRYPYDKPPTIIKPYKN